MGMVDWAYITFLIDFGIAMKYCDSTTGNHIPFCCAHCLTGMPAFASINSHLGTQLECHDNVELLAYLLIFFSCNSLPWLTNTHMQRSTLTLKQKTPVEALCGGLLQELATLLTYSQTLSFSEEPDYDYIWMLFQPLITKAHVSMMKVANNLSFPIYSSLHPTELISSPHLPYKALQSPRSHTQQAQELLTPSHSKAPAIPICKRCQNLAPTPCKESTKTKRLSIFYCKHVYLLLTNSFASF